MRLRKHRFAPSTGVQWDRRGKLGRWARAGAICLEVSDFLSRPIIICPGLSNSSLAESNTCYEFLCLIRHFRKKKQDYKLKFNELNRIQHSRVKPHCQTTGQMAGRAEG